MAEGAGTIEVDTESSIPELPTIDESQRQIWTFASSGWLFAYHFGKLSLGSMALAFCACFYFGVKQVSQAPGPTIPLLLVPQAW